MTFKESVTTCFAKFATFSGRASRSEFWYFALFQIVAQFIFGILDGLLSGFSPENSGPLNGIFSLIVILPSISVSVRRLHDRGKSGWWWWLWLIPVVGWIILLVWFCTKGSEEPNEHGNDPLAGGVVDTQISHRTSIPSVDNRE